MNLVSIVSSFYGEVGCNERAKCSEHYIFPCLVLLLSLGLSLSLSFSLSLSHPKFVSKYFSPIPFQQRFTATERKNPS